MKTIGKTFRIVSASKDKELHQKLNEPFFLDDGRLMFKYLLKA